MITVLGQGPQQGQGNYGGSYFQIARVKDIVLGPYKGGTDTPDINYRTAADLGKISYEVLYSPIGSSQLSGAFPFAYPMWGFIKQLPVLNEIVYITAGPTPSLNDDSTSQGRWYMPAYQVWSDPNHNAFPNLKDWKAYLDGYRSNQGYEPSKEYNEGLSKLTIPLGFTFTENSKIKSIKPFEGDTTIQGRFGQSIRMGSTVSDQKEENTWSSAGKNGDPITIIVNSQGTRPEKSGLLAFDPIVEDINLDGSCIFMTSTQEIVLEDVNSFSFRSFGINIDPQRQPVTEIRRPIVIPSTGLSNSEIDNQVQNA